MFDQRHYQPPPVWTMTTTPDGSCRLRLGHLWLVLAPGTYVVRPPDAQGTVVIQRRWRASWPRVVGVQPDRVELWGTGAQLIMYDVPTEMHGVVVGCPAPRAET